MGALDVNHCSQEILTEEAAAAAEEEAEALAGAAEGSGHCEPGGLGSTSSELSFRTDEGGTSMGRQEVDEDGDVPLRLLAEGGLARLHGAEGGGELPVEGTDAELKSSRSVTDTDSSPGLEDVTETDTQNSVC